MNIPANLKYTNDDEWIRLEGEEAYVGITDYAQPPPSCSCPSPAKSSKSTKPLLTKRMPNSSTAILTAKLGSSRSK